MDHYPFFDAERATLIADIRAQMGVGSVPPHATPQPLATPPPPVRFVKFSDQVICQTCQLDVRYCRGHAPADPANDGAEAGLAQRIADARRDAGGR